MTHDESKHKSKHVKRTMVATTVKWDNAHTKKARTTWEAVLGRTEELPNDWIHHREVLVGTRLVSIGQRP